eukprot:4142582-Pyramimonas_sp.AAC.1
MGTLLTSFAREKVIIPSPLLRTSVQAHRANSVSAGTRDIRRLSRSPVQASRSPPLKQAMVDCFAGEVPEQSEWREAPMQS